ncbi:MAG: NYN domain-containing protein [Thermoanaerobaculaceae bacterium]|nr:NYN domain-containing protein [Thermoanaerobaculaceae bacterium]
MPWLLDGNNLAHGGSREKVRRAALAVARHERVRIVVYFDGAPPPGVGGSESLGAVEIRYVGHADSAIIAFLRPRGRGWRVATDDRELARLARDTGAEAVSAAAFWGKAAAASAAPAGAVPSPGCVDEVAYFQDPRHRLPAVPKRVPRGRRRPGRG